MKKRFLCLLLALAMVLALTPAVLAESPVGDIDSSEDFYAAAAAGGSYRLTSNITLEAPTADNPLEISSDFSLDGQGFTITGWYDYPVGGGYAIDFYNQDTPFEATLQNINFTNFGNGATTLDTNASVINCYSNCSLTIKNCTFTNFNRQAVVFAPSRGGSLTMENCTIDCANSNPNYTIQKGVASAPGSADTTATIRNCTITNSRSTSTGWSAAAIEVISGTAVIEGCTITNSDIGITVEREYYNDGYDVNSNATLKDNTITGCPTSVKLFNNMGTTTTADIDIMSGEYDGDILLYYSDETPETDKKSTIEYYGGLYRGQMDGEIASDKLKLTLSEDGDTAYLVADNGDTVSDLPVPEKAGSTFLGWYTANGQPLPKDLPLTELMGITTVYARFEALPKSDEPTGEQSSRVDYGYTPSRENVSVFGEAASEAVTDDANPNTGALDSGLTAVIEAVLSVLRGLVSAA